MMPYCYYHFGFYAIKSLLELRSNVEIIGGAFARRRILLLGLADLWFLLLHMYLSTSADDGLLDQETTPNIQHRPMISLFLIGASFIMNE